MEKIPFAITVRDTEYKGYLITNETAEESLIFFAFIDDHIVGILSCPDSWKFEQHEETKLCTLSECERKKVAIELGNIAVAWYSF